jgi:PHD/YefM family antitoxin component YafN of YafNO toxin-antitoxin module
MAWVKPSSAAINSSSQYVGTLQEETMPVPPLLGEPGRVDEPQAVQAYSQVLTQVAAERRPVIVRRNGVDLAAVIPLEYLELLREAVARQEAEELAAQIDWSRAKKLRPPQAWFDDQDNPFESEEGVGA